ncbi:hypothetical protein [Photobacterium damselae]|uniref:hypothetical protein n=1 Tax=Photobacterium damselae TaxID=38293 RepID=UPI004068128C
MNVNNRKNRLVFLLFFVIAYSSSSFANILDVQAMQTLNKCFEDMDVVVQIKGDKDGDSMFLADKFVKHGVETAISMDEYIDRTVFGHTHSSQVYVYCSDVAGEKCIVPDANELDGYCHSALDDILTVVASDVR